MNINSIEDIKYDVTAPLIHGSKCFYNQVLQVRNESLNFLQSI